MYEVDQGKCAPRYSELSKQPITYQPHKNTCAWLVSGTCGRLRCCTIFVMMCDAFYTG